MNSRFEWKPSSEEPDQIFESLKGIEGAEVALDPFIKFKYRVQFREGESIVSIFLTPHDDQSGADLAITNMTTLPDQEKGRGYGSVVLQRILEWAKQEGYKKIIATQVQGAAKTFWEKNGFVWEDHPGNDTNDYIYVG